MLIICFALNFNNAVCANDWNGKRKTIGLKDG